MVEIAGYCMKSHKQGSVSEVRKGVRERGGSNHWVLIVRRHCSCLPREIDCGDSDPPAYVRDSTGKDHRVRWEHE
jgi:hypothetical protein